MGIRLLGRFVVVLVLVFVAATFARHFDSATVAQRFFASLSNHPRHIAMAAGISDDDTAPAATSKLLSWVLGHRHPGPLRSVSNVSSFWRFVPKYEGSATLGSSLTFTTECFSAVTVSVDRGVTNISGSELVGVHITTANSINDVCYSKFLVSTGRHTATKLVEVPSASLTYINITGASDAERWLLMSSGVRIFTFNASDFEVMASVIDTALLFLPLLTGNVDELTALNNMNYFNTFTQIQPPVTWRENPEGVPVNESDVFDGDLLFVRDMDGMGPSIALGTGSTANHVAMALRNPATGELLVCESASPEIRCTAFAAWVGLATLKPATVVLAPLKPSLRAAMNKTAAWAFINASLGIGYGFPNFLFGWIDTPKDNLPCFPPDFQRCLVYEHLELVAAYLDALSPTVAATYFGQAMNHRINTTLLPFVEVLQVAKQKYNLTGEEVIAIPERDAWVYDVTRGGRPYQGRSMVCSTFVCSILKVSGAFGAVGAEIECGEQAPWNMVTLQLFDEARMGRGRPAECQTNDPDNAFCVLTGDWTFQLGLQPNLRPLIPNAGNECPSLNPDYNRSLDC